MGGELESITRKDKKVMLKRREEIARERQHKVVLF